MDPNPVESLTRREIEILRLREARLSNAEIAAILHISTEAVERDASRIYQKLTAPTALEPPGLDHREPSVSWWRSWWRW